MKIHKNKRKKLDKRSYILFALIGLILIGVLLILQTRFKQDMRLSDDGYAIVIGTITDSLNADPSDAEAEISETVSMYEFSALDYFYTQRSNYYLGEDKKTQIDVSYPIYMKHGTTLQIVDSSAILFDEDYSESVTYRGLILQGGYSFNISGEQADPMKFLFMELNNGNFINLGEIYYEEKNREYDINENSIIHFEDDYFSYYEYEDGALLYKYRISVTDDTVLTVGGVDHTYDELLKLLKIRSDIPSFDGIEIEPSTEASTEAEGEGDESEGEKESEAETVTDENVTKDVTEEETTTEAPSREEETGDKDSPGVRPDYMRPDKNTGSDEETPEKVQQYVKPTVTVLKPFTANVYRLISEIEVVDPAKRIDNKKMIQFEVYEIGKGGKETLVTRGYCSGSGEVVLGGGSVKPLTSYRVVGFFTYNDEYNVSQVEQLGEWNVTTKGVDTLGTINMLHAQNITYSDRIELENISYDENSDAEAIYGISTTAGIRLVIKNEAGTKTITQKNFGSSDITNFKRNVRLVMSTLAVLDAKTTYQYEFVLEDYFGNKLKLTNEIGYAITSNHTPKASLDVVTNEIANVQIEVNISDVDAAAIPKEGSTKELDIYLVLQEKSQTVTSLEDESVITYYKLEKSEYSYSETEGLKVEDLIVTFDSLDLDEGMFALVYCDYDLDNKQGPQRFMNIGQLKFTTTGLSSLGRIYIDVVFDETNLTSNSLPMTFKLNDNSTNPELSKLIVGLDVDVEGGAGDDVLIYTTLGFSPTQISNSGSYVYEEFRNGETLGYTAKNLESMTTYNLIPTIYLEYNGRVYDNVPVTLSKTSFKTLRKPAEVVVEDLLFAAGTLVFDVTVNDPDETIVGASGDKIVINLYTTSGEFVKATRVNKNQTNPQTVSFTNLDVDRKYEIRFMAVEYNEGYSNATYKSNHIIKTITVTNSVRLDGSIKLQEINSIADDNLHYNAIVKATMNDPDHYLSGSDAIPYYITIKKNDKLVDNYEYWKNEAPVSSEYITNYEYLVDKGENTYTLTLSVIISGREMILDTLEFTSETTVSGFATAYEMIDMISANPEGKFVATNSFVLNGNTWNFPGVVDPGDVDSLTDEEKEAAGIVLEQGLSGTAITTIFNGKIDFQGFTLTHNYRADGQNMFTNIGADGVIENIVYKVYWLNESYIYDDACICYRNYGRISDIYIEFAGATNILDNRITGLISRTNCSTGIIENFVVHNNPQELNIGGETMQLNGFSAYQHAGLVTSDNYGTIRYGYVYGDNIIATNTATHLDRRIGGIVGTNQSIGKVYSVYSLLNVDQALRDSTQNLTYGYRYGAVCGYSAGTLSKLYSTAESMYTENKNDTVNYYQKSPVVGDSANRNSSVYYYSPSGFDYIYAVPASLKGVNEVSLNNLYDVGWQTSILTDNFDASLVEVGYYPHVILAEDLPEQEYIPLPTRIMSSEVDVSRATVKEYYILYEGTENETNAALVEFVFSNRDGLDIVSVDIEGLTVKLDLTTAKTEDGYTTIMGIVSNPQTFTSEYLIRKVSYYRSNSLKENTTDYTLLADFYRSIYTVDDWYNYVVLNTKNGVVENVRLMADLDFAGVDASRIMVAATFKAKLDGNGHYMRNIDLQTGLKTTSTGTVRNLFTASPSIDYSGSVTNLYIDNYKAGGTYTTNNKTYVARYGAVFRYVRGTVDGVHLTNAQITSFDYMGGVAAYVDVGGEIKNCTVSNIELIYQEPDDQNIDASIGGVVGQISNGRITHCLATDVNITAEEMKSSNGIGGVVGYAVNTAIDTAYAQGEIETRGNKAGGVIGEYYSTSASVACVKNIYAKVNIISYTDAVGGLIGQINLTQDRISERNNFSGIAFGNVYVANTDSENITHTIGSNIGKNVKFYGTDEQLVNGIAGINVDDNEYAQTVVQDLLSYDSLSGANAEYTYLNVMDFEDVYDYSGTAEGKLPKMYYADSKVLLPNQKDIMLNDIAEYDIEVTNVFTDSNSRIITVELRNVNNYKITDIKIDKLKYHYADLIANPSVAASIEAASDYSEGYTRIYLQYETEENQEYFLDSYVLENISFYAVASSHEMTVDEVNVAVAVGKGEIKDLETFSRIGATLYMDISSEEEWNSIVNRESNGHLYENYRITADLDFSTKQVYYNLRIGRLTATSGSGITIRNITLSGQGVNLISRLNSGMSNLTFENCTISSKSANCTGLIGINNGNVVNCNFKNITITPMTANMDEAGIIAHQNGGTLENITLDNVKVFAYASNKIGIDYVGALCGKITDGSEITNITANNLEVYGATTVGGLAGQIYITNIDNVTLKDVIVTSNGNYAGGLTGRLGTDSNGRSGNINNVSITGTPTYDSQGVINGSTTIITNNAGSYTGGVAGQNYHVSGEDVAISDYELAASGIVVKGYADCTGGIFGYNYSTIYHITISNSLIHTADTTDTSYKRVGGLIGYEEYGTLKYLTANNIKINSKNHSQVGGLVGYCYSAGMQYCSINDSAIIASSKTVGTWTMVGGAVGLQNAGTLLYNGVFNTVISADSMDCVGGVVGQNGSANTSGASVQRCFNISDYDEQTYAQYGNNGSGVTRYTAVAIDDYYIQGNNNVGGIVGKIVGGNIQYSYSNANVIAANGQCAGGITGYYGNDYVPIAGGGKSYANTYIVRNYFAGTVTAIDGYAGGAFGRTGLLAKGYGTDSAGVITGSGENGSRIKGVNGNANEMDKTYGNIIFADTITGAEGKTRNFAADDKLYSFTGKNNTLWEGTIVNGEYTCNILNNNAYAYDYWNPTNALTTAYPLTGNDATKLLLFKHSDLDGSQIASSGSNTNRHNRASMFYRNIGWSMAYTNSFDRDYANRNMIWAVSIGNVCVDSSDRMITASGSSSDTFRGMKNEYEAGGYDTGSYLPQIRSATNSKYASDYSITLQNTVSRLPLPKDDSCVRVALNTLVMATAPDVETYGLLYASDVNKINLEFSADLIGKGYFVLNVGGVEIANEVINKNVYTFSYNFTENIDFEYGDSKEMIDSITFEPSDVQNKIMVYDEDYYFISEDGITSSEGTHSGDYVMLMNGKALDSMGNIWNVNNWTIIGSVADVIMQEEANPLWSFEYMNYEIHTYAKQSHILTGNSIVVRNDQLFVRNNKLYTVDGSIKTNKTDILLYNLNGTDYITVLGNDGFMVDLFNSECNLPEEVDNKAIVRMTNTLDADVPYVILQYSNGGLMGYNYATGEILFDNTIEDNVSLLTYAKEFFAGEKVSMYASISDTYKANATLAASIHSTADLEEIVGISMNQSTAQAESQTGTQTETQTETETETQTETDVQTEAETVTITETETETQTQTEMQSETQLEDQTGVQTEEDSDSNTDSTKFMTLYNSNTGNYEIVNVNEYLSEDVYVTENEKLGIDNFSKYSNGYATSKVDVGQERGLIFYIIPVVLVLLIAGGVEVYIKCKERNKGEGA